jgi:hypothetical protein
LKRCSVTISEGTKVHPNQEGYNRIADLVCVESGKERARAVAKKREGDNISPAPKKPRVEVPRPRWVADSSPAMPSQSGYRTGYQSGYQTGFSRGNFSGRARGDGRGRRTWRGHVRGRARPRRVLTLPQHRTHRSPIIVFFSPCKQYIKKSLDRTAHP